MPRKQKPKAKKKPAEKLTKDGLAERLGISIHTIEKWLRDGCPKTKKGREVFFNVNSVARWMGGHPRMAARYMHRLRTQVQTKEPVAGDSIESFKTSLARSRHVEQAAFTELQDANKDQKPGALTRFVNSSDQLRKLEKDWAKIQTDLGEVVSVAEVKAAQYRVGVEVRDSLLSLPARITPELVGLNEADIFERLQAEVKDSLRSLCRALEAGCE